MRQHGHEYGADSTMVLLAGSSAGGHLAALAALTPNDPVFQPGFESEDTSVTAAICLGSYYGRVATEEAPPSTPLAYVRGEAPPFFVAHGDLDTLVPVGDARRFVESVRELRGVLLCTPSCAALSTLSTCSTPSASRRSSMRSRPSPPGSGRIRAAETDARSRAVALSAAKRRSTAQLTHALHEDNTWSTSGGCWSSRSSSESESVASAIPAKRGRSPLVDSRTVGDGVSILVYEPESNHA